MLHADDLISSAHCEEDLNRQMNTLEIYADMFKVEFNQKKTKVRVFNEPRRIKNVFPKFGQLVGYPLKKIDGDLHLYLYLVVIFRLNSYAVLLPCRTK